MDQKSTLTIENAVTSSLIVIKPSLTHVLRINLHSGLLYIIESCIFHADYAHAYRNWTTLC